MKVNEEEFGYRFSFERARAFSREKCGDDGKKDTPVPISNTEVKLLSADCSEGLPLVRVGRRHAVYINPIRLSYVCVRCKKRTR